MGKFNTIFSSLSTRELHALFSSTHWNNLTSEHRVAACQEVENRLADARETESRSVTCEDMNGSVYGYQSGDTIRINSNLIDNGNFRVTYTDFEGNTQTRFVSVDAPGWEIFDTVNHEDMHGYWEDLGVMPDTYITYESDPNLYRIQACERAAFDAGERNTFSAIKEVEMFLGIVDPDAQTYINNHSQDNYQNCLNAAKALYNDENIESTLNSYITNTDLGIVPENPSASYDAIDNLYYMQSLDLFLGVETKENILTEQSTSFQNTSHIIKDGSEIFNVDTLTNQNSLSSGYVDDGISVFSSEFTIGETVTDGVEITNDSSQESDNSVSASSESSYSSADLEIT